MKNYAAKNVTEFIKNSPIESRKKLKELRQLVKSTIPDVEEKISWGIPFYRYHGLLAGFTPCKHYILFGLVIRLENTDRKILEEKGYKTGKKTIQIRFDQKIPIVILKQMLKTQARINKTKQLAKSKL